MDLSKLTKLETAKNIIEEEFKDFQWNVTEIPIHQSLGRYLAEDYTCDEKIWNIEEICLRKGQRITPAEVGMLATLGKVVVSVFTKPLISIISIGDELVSVIEEPIPGKVRDSNSFALAALIQETGCDLGGVYLLRDEKELIKETLQGALSKGDLVIVSGGTSSDGKGITAEAIQESGKPGIIVRGLNVEHAEGTILGVIEDTHCACCNRKSLIAALPGDPQGVFASYKLLIDGLIKKIFFSS